MRLTEGQRKLAVVCLATVFVLALLSFVEPGYHQICADKKYPRPEDCASYNAVAYFFIQAFDVLNEISPALTAIATVGIGIFTWTLWTTSRDQGRLNQAALKLASDEFVATHRPKLFVQAVFANIWGAPPHETIIEFIVVNGGEAKAYPIKALGFSYIQGVNSIFDPKETAATPVFPEGKDLEPGERITLKVQSASIKNDYNDFLAGGRMFVLGRVEYAGKDGIVRVTGFCREYSRETGAYSPVPNSEHEYAY
jgi:hypothetical protein